MRVCHTTGEDILPVQAVQVHLVPAYGHQAHAEPHPPAQLLCEKDGFRPRVFSLPVRVHSPF